MKTKIKLTAEVEVLSKALADLNVVANREITLKSEQRFAIRALLAGKDVLAVLPTGWQKPHIPNVCSRHSLSAFHFSFGEH